MKKQNRMKENKKNITDEHIGLSRFFELATTNKKYVNVLNLHEFKNELTVDYKRDFELNGLMIIGAIEHETNIRFENVDDFESSINAIDIDYDCEDVTFTGYVYQINTPPFNVAKRSAYDKSTNYMQEILEYQRQNCYIPTSGMCFIKCIKNFSDKDYTEELQGFIRNEKYRSGVMASARIQPFCRKYNINIGCSNGKKTPRTITQRNIAFKVHRNHFCLIWKSNDISFKKTMKEVKITAKLFILLYLINMLNVLTNLKPNLRKSNLR